MMNEDIKKQIMATVEYGMNVELIKLIAGFSLRNNKTEINDAFKNLISNFFESLDANQKLSYSEEVKELVSNKMEQLKKELSLNYDEEQIKEILEVIGQAKIFNPPHN